MSRWRQRVRLEDGLKLDLNRLIQWGVARPGAKCYSTIRWSYRRTDHEIASGRLTADLIGMQRGWLRLELGALDQWIDLEPAPRHFGGRQWYFICPVTGRRASVLWKPPGATRFASRQSWGRQVAHGSQFQPGYVRADLRATLRTGSRTAASIQQFPSPERRRQGPQIWVKPPAVRRGRVNRPTGLIYS